MSKVKVDEVLGFYDPTGSALPLLVSPRFADGKRSRVGLHSPRGSQAIGHAEGSPTMRHKAAKVSTHDAVPGRALALVKLFSGFISQGSWRGVKGLGVCLCGMQGRETNCALDVLGNVLLDGELGHGLLGFNCPLLAVRSPGHPTNPNQESCLSHTNFDRLGLQILRLFVGSKKEMSVVAHLLGSTMMAYGERVRTISADLTWAVSANQ